MPKITLTLKRPHLGQQQILREMRRFNVICCGRRYGKTVLGQLRLARPLLNGYPVAWFSPTYKMLAEIYRDFELTFKPVIKSVNKQLHRIELITGGVLDMWSLEDPDAVRGRKYKRVVIDEAALVKGLLEAWNLAIRPTLTDWAGDADFYSTPKGLNDFHTLWQRGQDLTQNEWRSWQHPTLTNPYIKPSEVEAARLELPERVFQQEYLALFLDSGTGVFRRVKEAATATPQEQALAGHSYVIGVDWAKLNDFTVFTVIDTTLMEVVYIDRFNQIDYRVQVGRLQALAERFRPTTIIAETNSIGTPLIEDLQRLGLPVQGFNTNNASKTAVIDALALAFEQGSLKILNDPQLISELVAFDFERLPSGLLRYGAPSGMHDDCVMSLALAYDAAKSSGPLLLW